MAEVDENGNSQTAGDDTNVAAEGTSPEVVNGNGQQEAVDLAKLKAEDLDTMDDAKRLEVSKLLLAKNRDLYARATKKPQATPPPNSEGTEPSTADAVKQLLLSERKRQFAYENQLSPEETDAVFRFNSKPTKEVLNDPFIKGGIDFIRAKKRVEDATPSTSNGSAKINGKTFAELTPKERAANFEAFRKQKLGR